jgi:putative OPT family oligopeptide transporter
VGHILGSTPWKQQVMLLLGVVVSCLVIPPVMELLFQVYGIGDVMPREGMDPHLALAAPPAALMAGITQAVFYHSMPWDMLGVGAMVTVLMIILSFAMRNARFTLSILGVAIGMYLPLASSTPIFIGALIALLTRQYEPRANKDEAPHYHHSHRGTLLACGLVAGSALMDVLMAIPFAMYHSPMALSIVNPQWEPVAIVLGVVTVMALAYWFYRVNQIQD